MYLLVQGVCREACRQHPGTAQGNLVVGTAQGNLEINLVSIYLHKVTL